MAVKEIDEKYRCSICGNEVMVTKVGGGTLVCCGEEMESIKKGSFLEDYIENEENEEDEEVEEYEKKEAEEEE